jgi:hypothetical protein
MADKNLLQITRARNNPSLILGLSIVLKANRKTKGSKQDEIKTEIC